MQTVQTQIRVYTICYSIKYFKKYTRNYIKQEGHDGPVTLTWAT